MNKETTKRVVLLSDEGAERIKRIADDIDATIKAAEWPEGMIEEWGLGTKLTDADFLRAALDQPQGEEREEWRVAWQSREGEDRFSTAGKHEGQARQAALWVKRAMSAKNVRIQKCTRTVIQTPWQDIDQQEGEQDG